MYRLNCYKDDLGYQKRPFTISISRIADTNDKIIEGVVFENLDDMRKFSRETDKTAELLFKDTKNIWFTRLNTKHDEDSINNIIKQITLYGWLKRMSPITIKLVIVHTESGSVADNVLNTEAKLIGTLDGTDRTYNLYELYIM